MAKNRNEDTVKTADPAERVRSITIQSNIFKVADKYLEGHVITAAEAHALNQTRAEGLRNNFAKTVKDVLKDREPQTLTADEQAQLQAELDAYAAAYVFSMGGGRVTDPIDAEAKLIATAMLDGLLQKNGIKKADYKEAGKYDTKLAEIMNSDKVRSLAVSRVEERKALAADIAF